MKGLKVLVWWDESELRFKSSSHGRPVPLEVWEAYKRATAEHMVAHQRLDVAEEELRKAAVWPRDGKR